METMKDQREGMLKAYRHMYIVLTAHSLSARSQGRLFVRLLKAYSPANRTGSPQVCFLQNMHIT